MAYNMNHVHQADIVFEQVAYGVFKVVKDRTEFLGVGSHASNDVVVYRLNSKDKVTLTYKDLTRPFYANFEAEVK